MFSRPKINGMTGWAAHDDQTYETSRKIRKLSSAWKPPAPQSIIAAADVSDLERMRELVTQAKGRFGHIDGVIHAAGIADYAGVAALLLA